MSVLALCLDTGIHELEYVAGAGKRKKTRGDDSDEYTPSRPPSPGEVSASKKPRTSGEYDRVGTQFPEG